MKIYNLIQEEKINGVFGASVNTFTTEQAASDSMADSWKAAAAEWGYECLEGEAIRVTSKDGVKSTPSCNDDGGLCSRNLALISNEKGDVKAWRIVEQDIDVQIAVGVEGGLVNEVLANADLKVDVYDLDVSEFADYDEQREADRKKAKFEKLSKTAGWRSVF